MPSLRDKARPPRLLAAFRRFMRNEARDRAGAPGMNKSVRCSPRHADARDQTWTEPDIPRGAAEALRLSFGGKTALSAIAVIGAGPAGLLFCIAARLRARGGCGSSISAKPMNAAIACASLRLPGGRSRLSSGGSERPHCVSRGLRVCPPGRKARRCLAAIAADLGVAGVRRGRWLSCADISRTWGRLGSEEPLVVVGADSVHSAVRELAFRVSVRWNEPPVPNPPAGDRADLPAAFGGSGAGAAV